MNPTPKFDHEKLDVYQVELAFVGWVTPLLEETKAKPAGMSREVCDQLDRASLSALLNTAEGNGKRQSKLRARFFDDARGSAVECAACLDALVAKKLTSRERIVEGKSMLLRVVGMLTKLIDRFDGDSLRVREEPDDLEPENRPRPRPRPSSSIRKKSGGNEDEGRRPTA
jgi:four helix bundle protein